MRRPCITIRARRPRPHPLLLLLRVVENADFQAYCGEGTPRFANDAERECAKVLDFYLPEQDLFLEITVMNQRLVTRKNRKLRKLRERYPGVQVKLFYKRDIERLAQRYRFNLAS